MNKISTFKQLVLNTLSGWGSVVMRSLIALVMIPVLLGAIGKDGYGLIGLLSVFVSLSSIADLGLRQALGRELAEQVARKDPQAFKELSTTALFLYVCIAGVLALIGFIIAPNFVEWMKVPETLYAEAIQMVRIYGCCAILLSFVTPVFSSGLTASLRFDLVNNIQTISSLVSNLLLLLLITLFPSEALRLWVAIMLLNSTVVCGLNIFFYKRVCFGGNLRFSNINFGRLKPLFQLGGYMYLLQVTFAISNQSAPLIISAFFGTSGVALYQPGGRISDLLRPVVLTLTNQLYPLTTKHHTNNATKELVGVLLWGTKYTLVLGVLVSSALFLLAEPLCRIWLSGILGESYMVTAHVMKCWAIIDFLTYLTGSQMSVLLGMKEMKFLVWSQVPAALLSVAVSIYIVGYTSYGISGVLYGAILINLIRRPLLIWYTAKKCGIKLSDYLIKSYAGSFFVFLLLMGTGLLVRNFYHIRSVIQLITFAAVFSLFWLFLAVLFVLTREDRRRIIIIINN